MTTVREDIVNAVLGTNVVDSASISNDEWAEVLKRIIERLKPSQMKGFKSLEDTFSSSKMRPSGPSTELAKDAKIKLPPKAKRNWHFSNCLDTTEGPKGSERSPPRWEREISSDVHQSSHILLGRNRQFYSADVTWERKVTGDLMLHPEPSVHVLWRAHDLKIEAAEGKMPQLLEKAIWNRKQGYHPAIRIISHLYGVQAVTTRELNNQLLASKASEEFLLSTLYGVGWQQY